LDSDIPWTDRAEAQSIANGDEEVIVFEDDVSQV